MSKLIIELDKIEARKLLTCLINPDPKGEDLDYALKVEDILVEYLNTKDNDKE